MTNPTPSPAPAPTRARAHKPRIALLGNPNTGKTTLFNRLCGVRAKTSNFPGTTFEARYGDAHVPGLHENHPGITVVDLPGAYALDIEQPASKVCADYLSGAAHLAAEHDNDVPDAVLIVLDATNLERNLVFAAEVLAFGRPTVVALNLVDEADRRKLSINTNALSEKLGCDVHAISARTGAGVEELRKALGNLIGSLSTPATMPVEADRAAWAREVEQAVVTVPDGAGDTPFTDRLDALLLSRGPGLMVFTLVMAALFWVVFRIAAWPMDWIDGLFGTLGGLAEAAMPAGAIRDLTVGGIIAGVGSTVIFLPQICILFFLISLLEDTGYLARASMMTDAWLRPFGLSGHAFVPLLSSHACALPAIAAARGIPDPKDRLATILAAPFMSCTARIPVYVLLTVILFPDSALKQSIAFGGCYVLGIVAGLVSALVARRTIAKGRSAPIALELPPFRAPSLKTALLLSYERGWSFLKKAGTLILAISIVLWWLGTYPGVEGSPQGDELRAQAEQIVLEEEAAPLLEEADILDTKHAAASSYLGRMGSAFEPIFEPIGYDRQLTVGVLASFAAREVFAATMAVQVVGDEDFEGEGVQERIANATRDDGSQLFTPATSWSLLVFYVLAMQCLPTLVLTAKEAGSWKYAGIQLAWMQALAWGGAFIAYQIVSAIGS